MSKLPVIRRRKEGEVHGYWTLFSGLGLGMAITNLIYGVFFRWESREKSKSSKDSADNSCNR